MSQGRVSESGGGHRPSLGEVKPRERERLSFSAGGPRRPSVSNPGMYPL
jgi:hypothetical protein